MVGCVAVAVLGLVQLASCSGKPSNAVPPVSGQAVPVSAALAVTKAVPVEFSTFGTVQPFSTVAVRAEVNGILTKVHFRKGQDVKKGDLLFTIDPRQYQAAVEQAEANLARDKAQGANAKREEERDKQLLEKGIMAPTEYETAATALEMLSAAARADQAALDQAKIQLERCSIRSPVDGRTGNLLVDEGNLVKATDATLVTVNQTRPIQVFFSILEADLPSVRGRMSSGKLEVRASLPNQESAPEVGELAFIDNAADSNTGTIQLAATFLNEDERLWPGQYVNVVLVLDVQKDAVVVPSVAVQTGRDGKYVFVIKPDNSAELRMVDVGITAGEETVITRGVGAGEQVVTDGQLRLIPGAKVENKTAAKAGAPPQGAQP
jgi:multidrug efflux system membrane fusion protein